MISKQAQSTSSRTLRFPQKERGGMNHPVWEQPNGGKEPHADNSSPAGRLSLAPSCSATDSGTQGGDL